MTAQLGRVDTIRDTAGESAKPFLGGLPAMRTAVAPLLITLFLAPVIFAKPSAVTYPAFPEAEYARFVAGGDGVITGSVFLRTVVGEVRKGAGSTVVLDPATSYSAPWWSTLAIRWKYKREVPPDPRFLAARKTTQADADGNFRFTGLASGRYYLRSVLAWKVPGVGPQGGLLTQSVEVKSSEPVQVMLMDMPEQGGWNIFNPDFSLEPVVSRQ